MNVGRSDWAVQAIPASQRNAFERDFAKSAGVLDDAARMRAETTEGAVRMGQLLLYAHYLTSGWMTVHALIMAKVWQAARHVEKLAGARFVFVEPPAGGVSALPSAPTLTQVPCEEAVLRWERTGSGPLTALRPSQEEVDPQLYLLMSADDFVLVLCALFCCNRGNKVAAFRLAYNLMTSSAVQTRVREVLLPRLAARGAGQSWRMTAEQLESVWLSECMMPLMDALGDGLVPAGSDAAKQTRKAWMAGAARLEELQPHCGPLVLSLPMQAAMGAKDIGGVCRCASAMARLGDEAGNDVASAIGHFTTASNILTGMSLEAPGTGARNPYPLGALREMLAKAEAAERRLERWHMAKAFKIIVPEATRQAIRDCMADFANLPDTAMVQLPHRIGTGRTDRGAAPAAPARAAGGAGAPASATAAATATAAGAGSSKSRSAASAPSPASAPASAPATAPAQAGGSGPAVAAGGDKVCDGCGMAQPRLQKCGRCRQRRYCSEACQAKDWRSGHKTECKRLAAEAAAT